jgi:hypothetical protein
MPKYGSTMGQNKKPTMRCNWLGFETIPQMPNTSNGPTNDQNNVANFGLFYWLFLLLFFPRFPLIFPFFFPEQQP